jgi:glutathione S-transferase
MRLHVKGQAPSALKVLIFIAECGRSIEPFEVTDTRSAKFLKLNPFGTVPVLETDSGEFITESLTICRYLDRLWGMPGLFGTGLRDRLQVELWERRADLLLFIPGIEYVHHTHPMFATMIEQQPGYADLLAKRLVKVLEVLEDRLSGSRYLAGETFSMADITAFLGVSAFAAFGAFEIPLTGPLRRWNDEVRKRPSMRLLDAVASQASGTH